MFLVYRRRIGAAGKQPRKLMFAQLVLDKVLQTNNGPASLPAGSTSSISVTFTPTASGSRSGTVTIIDSVAGSTQSVGLSGAGVEIVQ
jgi:hypothetical protein